MSEKKFNVFGVGNAIVDILAVVDDAFISDCGLEKGGMTLMETDRQSEILTKLKSQDLKLASGGSAANTMVAIAQSGGTGIYTGKVAADEHGQFYQGDMEAAGVESYLAPVNDSALPTGTSIILTTPDAERTMCTHLGVSATLHPTDVDLDRLADCQACYVEGYLWTGEDTRAACLATFEQAKKLGIKTTFTFSDLFLVDLFKDDFRSLVKEYCDVIFCNADEARKFFDEEDVAKCAELFGEICELNFLTDGGNGCYVTSSEGVQLMPGFDVKAVDTVGAGDAFAGGALYGITNDLSPAQSAKWGNFFASKVVEQFGPRLESPASLQDNPDNLLAGE